MLNGRNYTMIGHDLDSNIPVDWYICYCETCLYTITFDRAQLIDPETCNSIVIEWSLHRCVFTTKDQVVDKVDDSFILITKEDVGDNFVYELHIPKNAVDRLTRREFADRMYDLMVKPLDIAADPLVREEFGGQAQAVVNVDTGKEKTTGWVPLENLPDKWQVMWCNKCFFSVTYDYDAMNTYWPYWDVVLNSAMVHDHGV